MPEILDPVQTTLAGQQPKVAAPEERNFFDTFSAAFQQENMIGSYLADDKSFQDQALDEEFDPIKHAEELDLPEEEYEDYLYAANQKHFNSIKNQKDRENTNKQILDEAGAAGIAAQVAAGLIDPINLVSLGAVVKTVKGAKAFAKGAGITSGATAVQEGVLQGTQENRSVAESTINIAADALLGGVLGAGANALSQRQFKKLTEQAESILDFEGVISPRLADQAAFDSVGAARSIDPENTKLAGNKAFQAVATVSGKTTSPGVRLANSAIPKVREIAQKLIEMPLATAGNKKGVATEASAELSVQLHDTFLANAVRGHSSVYKALKKDKSSEKLNQFEFNARVASAMRRNDVDPKGNKYVEKAAQSYRKELYDVEKDNLIKAGMLPDDVSPENADSYLNRWWNQEKVVKEEVALRDRLSPWAEGKLQSRLKDLDEEINNPKIEDKELNALLKEKQILEEDFDDLKFDLLGSVVNSIKGVDSNHGFTPFTVGVKGPLKKITVDVPDEMIEDFLINDISLLSRRFSRLASGQQEIKKKFGTLDFSELEKELIEDYNQEVSKVVNTMESFSTQGSIPEEVLEGLTKSEKSKLKKLHKDFRRSRDDLKALWDLVGGTYRDSDLGADSLIRRGGQVLRQVAFMKAMGGITISSMTDVAMPIFVHGIGRTMKSSIVPLVKSLGSKSTRGELKMAKEEARTASLALETELNSRLDNLFSLNDPYATGTRGEQMISNMTAGFGKYSGLNAWNNSMKQVASITTQNRILSNAKTVNKGGKLSDKEVTYMATLGFGEDETLELAKLSKHFSNSDNDLLLSNLEDWGDRVQQDRFRAALRRDADRTNLTVGFGDKPIFANKASGKILLQFTSFMMASNQKILLAGMQRADSEMMQGMLGLITMGMAIEALKLIERGKELPDDPSEWIKKGVDRSGIISLLLAANNLADDPLGVKGYNPRWQEEGRWLQNAIGPTAGTAVDLMKSSRAVKDLIASGEANDADLKAIRSLMPYQNMIGIRYLFDEMEEGLKNTVGK